MADVGPGRHHFADPGVPYWAGQLSGEVVGAVILAIVMVELAVKIHIDERKATDDH